MKRIGLIWIACGIIGIFLGIRGYYHYSNSGVLFILIIPNILYVKDIILGLLSVWIGTGMMINPQKQIKNIHSVIIWILGFVIISTIISSIITKQLDLFYLLTLDYLYLPLSIYSIKMIDKREEVNKDIILFFIKENIIYMFSGLLIGCAIIWGISLYFPYEFFY